MIIIDKEMELRPVSASNDDTFSYCIKLAKQFEYNEATLSQLEKHFKDEVYLLFEVWVNHQRIGIAYITKRIVGNLSFYTLDGYSDTNSHYKYSIRAGQLVRDHFIKTHPNDDLYCGSIRESAGTLILLRKLKFKPIKHDNKYIYYRYNNPSKE